MGLECSIGDQEEPKKIYVLPPLAERDFEDMSVLILTDGNNRAKGLNEGYDDGGKNVVKMAEYAAERGDVSTLVACIMSRDNAEKRSEDFIWRLYQAFAALGIRIETKGTLIKDGIRLEVHGDMKGLREKGGVRKKFVDMVENVCKKTHGIRKPRLTLVLGINYDSDIALDRDVDVIYRSGVEIPNALRLSDMRTHPGIKNYGSTTLWPNVTTEEFEEILEITKQENLPVMHLGYSPDEILHLTGLPVHYDNGRVSVHIPFTGPPEKAAQVFSDHFRTHASAMTRCSVHVHGKAGESVTHFGNPHATLDYQAIPAAAVFHGEGRGNYDCIVAPGVKGSPFILPSRPEIEHATVIACDKDPAAINQAVQNAVNFCMNNERLKGAERKTSGEYRFLQYIQEFGQYQALAKDLKLRGSADDVKNLFSANEQKDFQVPENYLELKEAFVAGMIQWAKEKGFEITNEPQFRAFVNYASTSLFMTYFPQYADRKETHREGTAERAFNLAKYMELVYMTDEYIYDYDVRDPDKKKTFIRLATKLLCEAAEGKRIDRSRIPQGTPNGDILFRLTREFAALRAALNKNGNQKMLDEWTFGMQNLMKGFAAEWSEELTDTNGLGPTTDIMGLAAKAPPFMKKKVENATSKLDAKNRDHQLDGYTDLMLYRYFLGIEDSIGAGMAFRTIACLSETKDVPAETMKDYEELCFLMNMYYRIANDISGSLSRRYSDRETKTDCCAIVASKHLKKGMSPEEALIKSVIELKTLLDELKEIIKEKRTALARTWPLLGIAFIHADIAELIYSKGHYRTVTSQQMDEYIHGLYRSAMLPQP